MKVFLLNTNLPHCNSMILYQDHIQKEFHLGEDSLSHICCRSAIVEMGLSLLMEDSVVGNVNGSKIFYSCTNHS